MKLFSKNRGQTTVIIALCIVALITMLGFVIDTGRGYIDHTRLQRSVDSAVLGGVLELPDEDPTRAEEEARKAFDANMNVGETAEINKDNGRQVALQINVAKRLNDDLMYDRIYVTASSQVYNTFGSFIGQSYWPLVAQAGARVGPIAALKDTMPFGIPEEHFEKEKIEYYTYYRLSNVDHVTEKGLQYVMFAPDQTSGTYFNQIVAGNPNLVKIGDPKQVVSTGTPLDSSTYERRTCDGIVQRWKTGTFINSLTGSQNIGKGCYTTYDDDYNVENINSVSVEFDLHEFKINGKDPRVVFIPVVRPTSGSSVEVVSFAMFYIAYAHYDPEPYGEGEGAMTEFVGYFVEMFTEGPVGDGPAYGIQAVEYLNFQ